MTEHTIATQEEWQAQRDDLLAAEKEITRRSDELARQRRELPWVPVEKDYVFETSAGTKSLADLFDGRSQLMIYHFMFGPEWAAGCPVCSSIADTLSPQVAHLEARDATLICSSRAPVEKLLSYRERMGWGFDWVSTVGTDFHRDLGFWHTEEELKPFLDGEIPSSVTQNAQMCGTDVAGYVAEGPGMSVYALEDGTVYRTYVTTARGLEAGHGVLRPARPDPGWAQRAPHRAALDKAPRRVRDGLARGRAGRVTGAMIDGRAREWLDAGGFFEWAPAEPLRNASTAQHLPRRVRRSRCAAAAPAARVPDEQHRLVRRRRRAQRRAPGVRPGLPGVRLLGQAAGRELHAGAGLRAAWSTTSARSLGARAGVGRRARPRRQRRPGVRGPVRLRARRRSS